MNPKRHGALLALIFALFLTPARPALCGGGDLVARVDGISVTKYELAREFQKVLPTQGSFHGGISPERMAEIREEVLEELIDRAYKVRYALEQEISVDNAAVEERYQKIRGRFASDKEFESALGGESPGAFRATVYRELLAQQAEEVAVDAKVKVSDEQVRRYYEENKERYKRPKQFRASHILVRVDPAANKKEIEAGRKKAEDLVAKARAGEDFYNLAYYNSDDRSKFVGGDLGYFHEGQTVKEFENALLQMKPGEVSDPVRTIYGFHIIKLVELNKARQISFDEVKDKIRATLEKEKRDEIYQQWMAGLKEKYALERFDQ